MSSTAPKHDEEQAEQLREEFGPNPELYKQLAEPFASKEQADLQLNRFLHVVSDLRKQHRIPEVVVVCAARYIEADLPEDSGPTLNCRALAMGAPEYRAQLSAMAFNQYALPEIERADYLRELATSPRRKR